MFSIYIWAFPSSSPFQQLQFARSSSELSLGALLGLGGSCVGPGKTSSPCLGPRLCGSCHFFPFCP